ncbi:pantetheine-phosphate adenylyltransferase [bacterium]|nr:pantetheine-phosphate adenylyltransferase [bacterium]
MRIGIYPGSFDPITLGHMDIIRRGLKLVDHLIIAVAKSPSKRTTFGPQERRDMIHESLAEMGLDLEVDLFEGLLVDYARRRGAVVIFRGLRAVSDFEFEFQMALMNKKLDPEIEVVFMAPEQEYIYLSSSLVREVASLGGQVSDLVTECVARKLYGRFQSDRR